jgi:hypothetical protein
MKWSYRLIIVILFASAINDEQGFPEMNGASLTLLWMTVMVWKCGATSFAWLRRWILAMIIASSNIYCDTFWYALQRTYTQSYKFQHYVVAAFGFSVLLFHLTVAPGILVKLLATTRHEVKAEKKISSKC